jgi:DNA polymerase-3 subunit chi
MTEIAFHFNAPDKVTYACRVARKLLRQGQRLVIRTPLALMDPLDAMLWNMAPQDFVAHCRLGDAPELLQASPIVLAHDDACELPHRQVLLNLEGGVPPGFGSFERLIEVVVADDEADRAAARVRWRHYVQRGYALVRHDLAQRV